MRPLKSVFAPSLGRMIKFGRRRPVAVGPTFRFANYLRASLPAPPAHRTTTAGGPAEIVRDGVDGLLVVPDDCDALARAMERMVVEKATRESFARAARQRVEQAFSLDQTVVRAIAEHDLGVRDTNAIAILNGVRWGA